MGSFGQRDAVLKVLRRLKRPIVAEVLGFVQRLGLFGRGIGFVDATCWYRHGLHRRRDSGPGTGVWRHLRKK